MDWKTLYQQKTVTAEEAVKHIKSGDRVVVAQSTAEPFPLTDALAADVNRLHDVEVVMNNPLTDTFFAKPEAQGHFNLNLLFVSGTTRKAVKEGRVDFTPCYFYQFPELFRTTLVPDVALIQVSRPDKHGYCSCGINIDYQKSAAQNAKIVIAETNAQMPRTLGDTSIHVSEIDYLIETDRPVREFPAPEANEEAQKIGQYVASLIENGSNLQFGFGAVPEAAIPYLMGKKDLGVYTEMFSDRVLDLILSGAVTNKNNPLHPGKIVTSIVMGSKRLYDYVDDNNNVVMYPIDFVNHPANLMRVPKLVAVNACVQVDFAGQVVAESIGPMQISGVGGQVDFVRGAAMSEGGKSVIVCPSTAQKGKVSRIVPFIDEGAAVTTGRNDVQYVVTEYGIAELKGKTLRQKARALINIAHPDFREQLSEAFEAKFHEKH
jgi:4-hydroxybutyrate CoA-transferase